MTPSAARRSANGAAAVGILQRLRDFSAAARLNRTMSAAISAREPSRLAASPLYCAQPVACVIIASDALAGL
jgi:hypothetical protein